jgi:glycosyltransferase involved in cell wall biosynthesis
MRVNVIIPCYNSARFLGDALDSVLRQTHADTTALVIDDGSTDATVEIARTFGSRVTVLQQPNSGPSVARNLGIDAAHGEYIAFLDADDRWHPEKLSRQLAVFAAHPECGLVHTAIRHIDDAGVFTGRPVNAPLRRETHGDCLALLLSRNTITTSSVVVRRQVLGHRRFLAGLHVAEDWDLWLRLALRTKVGYVDDELTEYRFHDNNTVRFYERMLFGELTVLARAEARGLVPAHRQIVERRRRQVFAALGHCAYERDDIQEARRLFRQAGRDLDFDRFVEYLAVLLPALVRRPAGSCWRRLRRALAA